MAYLLCAGLTRLVMSLEQNTASHSGKPVAIFDLDGTLITAHVWQCLVKHQVRQRINLLPALAYPLVHYPLYPLARVGLIDVGTFRRIWAERTAAASGARL